MVPDLYMYVLFLLMLCNSTFFIPSTFGGPKFSADLVFFRIDKPVTIRGASPSYGEACPGAQNRSVKEEKVAL